MKRTTTTMATSFGVGLVCMFTACSIDVGTGPDGVTATITIAGKSIEFKLLDIFKPFAVSAGAPAVEQAASVRLFEEEPDATPQDAQLRLEAADVKVFSPASPKRLPINQAIAGSVEVAISIAEYETEPCAGGVFVGTIQLTLSDDVVTIDGGTLDVPSEVFAILLTGSFSICVQVSGDIDVEIAIDGMSVDFGPAVEEPDTGGNDNVSGNLNDNASDNVNDNVSGDLNDNAGDNVNNNASDTVNDNSGDVANENGNGTGICVIDSDCNSGETCEGGACVPAAVGCVIDSDCTGAEEVCDAGVCVPATVGCVTNADCTDIEVCDAGVCVPEFTEAVVGHVGSEQLIVGPIADEAGGFGFVPESGFNVTHVALSGDGNNLWFITYNQFFEVEADRQRLYFIQADGTNLLRSAVPLDTITDGFNTPIINTLATDDDGLRAVIEARRNIPPPVSETATVFFDVIGPGLHATAIYDTLGFDPRPPFGDRRKLRMSDDGNFVSWSDETRIWRLSMNAVNSAPDNEFTVSGHACGTFAGDTIGSYDRSTVDVRTLFSIRAVEGTDVCNGLILGSSLTDSAVQDLTSTDFTIQSVHISDDGLTMAYCFFSGIGSQADPAPCFVQGVNGPAAGFSLTPITDTWSKFTDIVLADRADRYRVVITTNVFAPNGVSVFETPGQDDRRMTGTNVFGGIAQSVSSVLLSDDGQVMVGLALTPGIYVLHDGVVGLPGFHSIESISYRFEGNAIIFRVRVASDNGVSRVQVFPMKGGIDPTEYLTAEENPFFAIRFGSNTFEPIEGSTDTFEVTNNFSELGGLIDDTYMLRIVAVDGSGSRTVFADIPAPVIVP